MTLGQIIAFTMEASLFLVIISVGLEARPRELGYLLRRPDLFARSIFSMDIVMLAFAIAVGLLFNMHAAVKIALIALAISPVPPQLAEKQKKAGSSADYSIGLVTAAAIAAIFIIPLAMEVLGLIFGVELQMPIGRVISIVGTSLFAPLGVGMLVRHFGPAFAARIGPYVSRVGTVILILAVLPVLVTSAGAIAALIGSGVIAFPVLFVVIGLLAGHLFGGPDAGNRTALALATARRHPGMAIAIASINFPDQKAVPAVVVCYLILGALLSIPYAKWRGRDSAVASQPFTK